MEPSPVPLPSLLKLVDPVRKISLKVFLHLLLMCDVGKKWSLSLSLSVLSQQMMIMEMFIITLVNRVLYRRTYDTLPSEAHDNNQNSKVLVEHDV